MYLCLLSYRQNPTMEKEQEITRKDMTTLAGSNFDASRDTKIIIHGFTHSAHEPWVQLMKDELLKHVRKYTLHECNQSVKAWCDIILAFCPVSRVIIM